MASVSAPVMRRTLRNMRTIDAPDVDGSSGAAPQQIVVGIDGSPSSSAALRWAAGQAARTGGTLEVLVALSANTSGSGNDRNTASDAVLETLTGVLGDAPTVTVSTRFVDSNLNVALINASREADLLVVGSDGHSLVGGWLHGATSQHCAAYAHCPVVVVQPEGGRGEPEGSPT